MSTFSWPYFFTFIGGMLVVYWMVFVVAVWLKGYSYASRSSPGMTVNFALAFMLLSVPGFGQDAIWQPEPLLLHKGPETVTIPVGDWVVALDSTGSVLIEGKLVGLHNRELIVIPAKQNRPRVRYPHANIGIGQISSLYHGEYRRVGVYSGLGFRKGFGYGFLAGMLLVTVGNLSLGQTFQAGEPIEGWMIMTAISLVLAGTASAAGTLGGIVIGLEKHAAAIEYKIEPPGNYAIGEAAP